MDKYHHEPVLAGVPQDSNLYHHFFLIYINDLPNGLNTNTKLFANDTSLFTIVQSTNALNNDLSLISKWAFSWKMFFDPDPSKPVQEV